MMNWVMPMPQIPNLASQTALVNNLVNNQFTKTVENLQVESSKPSSFDNKRRASKSKIVKVCSQSVSDNESLEKIHSPNFKIEESLDDLVEGFDSKSVSLNMGSENTDNKEEDEDTDSEDTMKLLCKNNVHTIRDSTPSKLRPESIVDRIKNSLSPAPQRHAMRLTENDKQIEVSKEEDINVRIRERERSVAKGVSQMRDNLSRDHSQRRERSATRERSVVRALSQVKEIMEMDSGATKERSVTRERAISQIRDIIFKEQACMEPSSKKPEVYETNPKINQIQEFYNSQSSVTIPDDMTMSCCSIIERFSEVEGSESEKDLLLRRLTEVIENEKKQVEEDIEERQEQLAEFEREYEKSKGNMEKRHKKERDDIKERHKREMDQLMEIQTSEEHNILEELAKLETELQNLLAPSQLLSTLTSKASSIEPRSRLSSRASCISPGSRTDMGDLEQELQCCSCKNLCKPPSKVTIFTICINSPLKFYFSDFPVS